MVEIRHGSCGCGCGGHPHGGEFLPGHDARHRTNLIDQAARGSEEALQELISRHWINPNARKFGVEIECYNVNIDLLVSEVRAEGINIEFMGYTHQVVPYWKIVTDSSIRGSQPAEVVSPPLPSNEIGFRQLAIVLGVLKRIGARVNRSCGFHVHIDMDGLNADTIKNFLLSYLNNNGIIDQVLAPWRRITSGNAYCAPWRPYHKALLNTERTVEQIAAQMDRYHTINVVSYPKYGTIELRQHQGTLNYKQMTTWIRLGMALLNATIRQEKPVRVTLNLDQLLDEISADKNLRAHFTKQARKLAA